MRRGKVDSSKVFNNVPSPVRSVNTFIVCGGSFFLLVAIDATYSRATDPVSRENDKPNYIQRRRQAQCIKGTRFKQKWHFYPPSMIYMAQGRLWVSYSFGFQPSIQHLSTEVQCFFCFLVDDISLH